MSKAINAISGVLLRVRDYVEAGIEAHPRVTWIAALSLFALSRVF